MLFAKLKATIAVTQDLIYFRKVASSPGQRIYSKSNSDGVHMHSSFAFFDKHSFEKTAPPKNIS